MIGRTHCNGELHRVDEMCKKKIMKLIINVTCPTVKESRKLKLNSGINIVL